MALSCGAGLWAFDAAVQAQNVGSGALRLPSLAMFARLRLNLVYYDPIFFLQTGALALLALQRTVQAREQQLGEARLATQQARLAALRFQLNPHFLFNTLNAISTLVGEGRSTDADEMIVRLSAFLRASLETDGGESSTLEVELETVQAYLDIEAVRFGERLVIRYACDEDISDALVPGLILQPLVDNAVKYAVSTARTPVIVLIQARRQGERLRLTVKDTGAPRDGKDAKPGTGVGLKNVAARLSVLYGLDAEVNAGPVAGGFAAEVNLPFRRAQSDATR